jgi:hypothetical protein
MENVIKELIELEKKNSLSMDEESSKNLKKVIDTLIEKRESTNSNEVLQEIKKITDPKPTKKSILNIKDNTERLQAIRENIELFD